MKCPVKGKPILDLKVYTKNRCWRVPGSTKWAECTSWNPALPEKKFFMKTRMCDRQGAYTYSAIDLGISRKSPHKRKKTLNPKPHTHKRVGKKRGASGVTTGERQRLHTNGETIPKTLSPRLTPCRLRTRPAQTPALRPRTQQLPEQKHTPTKHHSGLEVG